MFKVGRPGEHGENEENDLEGGDTAADTARQTSIVQRAKPARRVIALAAVAAAVAAGGLTYAFTRHSSQVPPVTGLPEPVKGPIHLVSLSPDSPAAGVDGADPIVLSFSAPLAADTPRPQLTPSVPGTWSVEDNMLVFRSTTPFNPASRVTVQIPAGPDGIRSSTGGLLTAAVTEHFTTGAYTKFGLAVLLAKLGYLPMTWAPLQDGAIRAAGGTMANPASEMPAGMAFDPPMGTFVWDAGYPASLQALWSPDQANPLLRGAVMAFEAQHNLTIDGSLTPRLWRELFHAAAAGDSNKLGYSYAIASKHTPETLTIWHDGRVVLRSLANTGIPVSPTVDGTFPVYLRFLNTIMSGTNPDGSHYSDPVSFVSYFNGGDAVHYFPRGGYGYQQSLGCVELPYTAAEQAYPYLTYGSLVTVTS